MKVLKIFISPLFLIFFNSFNHNLEYRRIPEEVLNKYLKISIYAGNLSQIEEALSSGANPNLIHALIHLAQSKQHSLNTKKDIYKLLLKNNLDVGNEVFNLLQDNSKNYISKIRIIENLLNIGIDPNVQILSDYPLLNWALQLNWPAKLKAKLVEKILLFKPELQNDLVEEILYSLQNYKNEDLDEEAMVNQCPVLDVLIDYGIDLNEKDKYYSTALYYALLPKNLPKNNPLQYIKYLVDKGADIFTVHRNQSAIDLLKIRNNSETLRSLRSENDDEILKYLYEIDRKSCER